MDKRTIITQAIVGFLVFYVLFLIFRLTTGAWIEGLPWFYNWQGEMIGALLPSVIFLLIFRGRSLLAVILRRHSRR